MKNLIKEPENLLDYKNINIYLKKKKIIRKKHSMLNIWFILKNY